MATFTPKARKQIIEALPAAATWLIDSRTHRPISPAATTPGTNAPQPKPNKFAGPCNRCHGHVAATTGLLAKDGGKWVVFHADGQCPDKTPTTAPQATPARAERPAKQNKFGGKCATCGAWVEAEAGILVKTGNGWKPAHNGACPAPQASEAAPAPRKADGPANLYPGRCTECDEWVEAGDGVRVKTSEGWKAAHRGLCPEEAEEAAGEFIELTAEQIANLPKQAYATVQLHGGGHRTFRIRPRKDTARRHPGAVEISYLAGSDNDNDYMPLARITPTGLACRTQIHSEDMRTALMILVGDPVAAQKGWSREHTACARCGRHLSNPDSLDIYLGPDCASK